MKVCPKSELATGQHWWILETGRGETVTGECKYCRRTKQFQNVLSGGSEDKVEGRHKIKPVVPEAPRRRGRPTTKPVDLEIPLQANTSAIVLTAPPSVMKAVQAGLRDGTIRFSGVTSKQVPVTYCIAPPGNGEHYP